MKEKMYPILEYDNITSASVKRKLIDLPQDVFDKLTILARKEGVSLKKLIEDILKDKAYEQDNLLSDSITDPDIRYLAGIIRDKNPEINKDDDRLQYLLNK